MRKLKVGELMKVAGWEGEFFIIDHYSPLNGTYQGKWVLGKRKGHYFNFGGSWKDLKHTTLAEKVLYDKL